MKVAVLGTLGMHLMAEVDRLPRPGEGVMSRGLAREPGGTGTWQAIAAARLGAEVTVYGRLGTDFFGDEILAALQAAADTAAVERVGGAPSGASLVLMGPDRQQLAAHVAGANATVDEEYAIRFLPAIREADALLLDLALPGPAVHALLARLPAGRPLVILGPIPPRDSLPVPWGRVDFLVGSREELAAYGSWTGGSPEEAARAGQPLLSRGVRHLVLTAGPDGAYLVESAGATRFPGHHLPVVDPTGAEEAFSAALAVKLAAGRGPYEAVGFATAAAALAASRPGGIPSLPTSAELQAFLSRQSSVG